jgi:hypothetical protein
MDEIKYDEVIESITGRRRIIAEASPEYIADFFRSTEDDSCKAYYIESEIPKDAKFIGVHFNWQYGVFQICYEHPSFDLIEYGLKLPTKRINIRIYHI